MLFGIRKNLSSVVFLIIFNKIDKTDCTNCEEYQSQQAHRGIAGRGGERLCGEIDGKLNILNKNKLIFCA